MVAMYSRILFLSRSSKLKKGFKTMVSQDCFKLTSSLKEIIQILAWVYFALKPEKMQDLSCKALRDFVLNLDFSFPEKIR